VQGDRDAVARERGDHAHLVAEPEQAVRRLRAVPVHEAVGHLRDGERPLQPLRGAVETGAQMRARGAQVPQEARPLAAGAREGFPVDQEAEIDETVLDRLQPGIATLEQDDLDRVPEPGPGGRAQREVGLEPDEPVAVAVERTPGGR
jgi:hypothetical protein